MTNANDFFGSGNGTESLYCHPFSSYVYTDGVKELVQQCKAYWLVDLVISHQLNKTVHATSFQVWELKRSKGDAFLVVATDGNKNEIARQFIGYSDFPYDEATLWLVDETLLLPNEY